MEIEAMAHSIPTGLRCLVRLLETNLPFRRVNLITKRITQGIMIALET